MKALVLKLLLRSFYVRTGVPPNGSKCSRSSFRELFHLPGRIPITIPSPSRLPSVRHPPSSVSPQSNPLLHLPLFPNFPLLHRPPRNHHKLILPPKIQHPPPGGNRILSSAQSRYPYHGRLTGLGKARPPVRFERC